MAEGIYIDKKNYVKPEDRRSFRIKESLPVNWQLKGKGLCGTGKVRNISISGMLLETKVDFHLPQNSILEFDPISQDKTKFVPKQGKMVWSRQKALSSAWSLWGIEFVDSSQEVAGQLRVKIQQKIDSIIDVHKFLNLIGWPLVTVMMILAIGVLAVQTVNYRNISNSAQMIIGVSSQQAGIYKKVNDRYRVLKGLHMEVVRDLEETRVLLSRTRVVLVKAQERNRVLSSRVSTLESQGGSAVAIGRTTVLEEENKRLYARLTNLKQRLNYYEGKIDNLQQGKTAILFHQDSIRSVKRELRVLRRQARLAKKAAQREIDRILLSLGNRGFVIKDGKPFRQPFSKTEAASKVVIDVQLVE